MKRLMALYGSQHYADGGDVDRFSDLRNSIARRPLNIQALIDSGAIRITQPGDGRGGVDVSDDPESWSLVSKYNDEHGATSSWEDKPSSYTNAVSALNDPRAWYDGKYHQVMWSADRLGLPDRDIYADTVNYADGGDVQELKTGGIKSAIQWTKDLLGMASPVERKALDDIYNSTRNTKREAISVGETLAPKEHFFAEGTTEAAPLPPDYIPFLQGAKGTPVYSAHTHPMMAATPSLGDTKLWANHWGSEGQLGHKDWAFNDPNVAAQDMWIRAMNGQTDITLMPGFARDGDTQKRLMDIVARAKKEDTWARKDVSPELVPLLREFSQAHGINSKIALPIEEINFFRNLHYMTDADSLARQTPVFMDANTRLAPNTLPKLRDLKAQDVVPDLLDFYKTKGFNPYGLAHGGEVPGYADAGKVIKPGLDKLIQYMRGISQPVQAHHASPHDFPKFKSSQIGTGEGNRDFGEGLYFAENPAVAAWYRKNFGGDAAHMYDVNIHEDPSKFLSLDTPLNEQGILGLRAADFLQAPKDWILRPPTRQFPRMQDQVSSPDFARFLVGEGGAGTRYFDSKSLARGHGTQNYVVAPGMDDILEITNKYADGGEVPGYSGGGAQIMRKGFDAALQPVLEYLGGLRRNAIPHEGKALKEKYADSSFAYQYGDEWSSKADKFPAPPDHPQHIIDAMTHYTGPEYGEYNNILRHFEQSPHKKIQDATTPYGLEWWRTGQPDSVHGNSWIGGRAAELAKYLQDMETELPYDIFRGARLRFDPEKLHLSDSPQVHGKGFGSFSFRPDTGIEWGTADATSAGSDFINNAYLHNIGKVPATTRIPAGTKVRGTNVAPYSEMPSEFEFLMAPFQGFDVKDVNLLQKKKGTGYLGPSKDLNRLLLDIEPSGIYDPFSPAIYRDGGEVEGYSGGGKFGALRSYAQAIYDAIKKPITVGVDTDVVPKIVKDGRFKSQFETGTSNGSYEPDYRAKFERDTFGLPLDLPVEKRPIYGHVADRDTLDTARHYGEWGAVLDPKVNERSTFFLGDSLGSAAPYGPYPFKPPTEDEKARAMLKSFVYDRYDGRGDKAAFIPRNLAGLIKDGGLPGRYLEAQIHDGLPWSDVRALIGKKVYRDADDAASSLYNIANIADRPSLAAWGPFHSLSKEPMRWMRADPGQGLNKIDEVPASALGEFGYEDGGAVDHLMTGYAGQFYNNGGEVPGYQTGGKLGKVASVLREALGPLNKVPSTDDFVYHATSKNRLNDIAEQGLKTHWPYEFTDQGSWPDGRITKRAYFASSPDIASSFAPADDGPTAFLRTYLDPRHISRESGTGDYFSEKLVPRERLEYLNDDGTWNPLKMWGTPK
jgi:hypothetical protein